LVVSCDILGEQSQSAAVSHKGMARSPLKFPETLKGE
jgi:hypothetical protein